MFRSDEFSRAWHEHQRKNKDSLRTRIMNPILDEEIGPLNGKAVLDAGCGNGFYIPQLLAKNPESLDACDISPFLLQIVKEEHPSVNVKEADLMQTWPYPDNAFDMVLAYNVIMDLPSIDTAIKEMHRVLKRGGTAHVVMVHTLYNLFFNDKRATSETLPQRLARYVKEESLLVDTVPGYDQFLVYRRPPSAYVNAFIQNGLQLVEMREVIVDEKVADFPKYVERMGAPLFAYYILKKK